MVELLRIKTSTAVWNIDGVEMRFQRRKNTSDDQTKLAIEKYIYFLVNNEYEKDWMSLKNIMMILTDTMVIRIGMTIYRNEFLKMFEYYSRVYVREWSDSNKSFRTNKLTVFPVFEFMFKNSLCNVQETNSAILKCIESDTNIFRKILDEQFCSYWKNKISDCIANNRSLGQVCKRLACRTRLKYSTELKMNTKMNT